MSNILPGGTAAFLGVLLASTAFAAPPTVTLEEPVLVETDPASPLDVDVGNSVEIKNTEGDPIGVRQRPGNGAYRLGVGVLDNGERGDSAVVPVTSHLKGVTIAAHSGDPGIPYCDVVVNFSGSAPVRFGGGDAILSAKIPAPAGTVHIPVADFYAFEGLSLGVYDNSVTGACGVTAWFQLTPVPVPITP